MIEIENKQLKRGKTMKRRGEHFATQSKLVRGGIIEIDTIGTDLEGLYIRTPDGQGVVGGFQGGRQVDGDGNTTGYFLVVDALGGNTVTVGNFVPSVDDSFTLGTSALAWERVYSTNPFTVVSDARDKEGVKEINYGLDTVAKLRPVSYKRKGKKDTNLGLIAQEVKEVIPEIVQGTDDTRYSVSYDSLVPVLVNAVKELKAEVDRLKKQIS